MDATTRSARAIAPRMAAIVKRYEARHRPEVAQANLLISRYGRPSQWFGIDEGMDWLDASSRCGRSGFVGILPGWRVQSFSGPQRSLLCVVGSRSGASGAPLGGREACRGRCKATPSIHRPGPYARTPALNCFATRGLSWRRFDRDDLLVRLGLLSKHGIAVTLLGIVVTLLGVAVASLRSPLASLRSPVASLGLAIALRGLPLRFLSDRDGVRSRSAACWSRSASFRSRSAASSSACAACRSRRAPSPSACRELPSQSPGLMTSTKVVPEHRGWTVGLSGIRTSPC